MNILISGGLGQIGSHIAELLLQRGDKVMAIDNLATGRQEHLEAQERLTIVEDSIANVELMTRLFNEFRPDVVVPPAPTKIQTIGITIRSQIVSGDRPWWIWPSAMAYSALFIFKRRCVMACIQQSNR